MRVGAQRPTKIPNRSACAGSPPADTQTRMLAATDTSDDTKNAVEMLLFLLSMITPDFAKVGTLQTGVPAGCFHSAAVSSTAAVSAAVSPSSSPQPIIRAAANIITLRICFPFYFVLRLSLGVRLGAL